MKFGAIFRYELSYRLRSPITWIYAIIAYGLPVFMVHVSSTENNRVINAPLHYAEMIFTLEFCALVITAGIFGDAATRDSETSMQPLFSTAPIGKLDYLAGRFLACFVLVAALFAGPPVMVALSTTLPWLSHFNWAPFQAMSFVQPFLLYTLPNLLIAASVIYTIAALTKNSLATYVGAVGLAISYLVVINQGIGTETIAGLLDPFGLVTLQNTTKYWTPAEQTTRLIGFPAIMLANRAIWISLALGLLVFLYTRFSFAHPGIRGRRRVQAPDEEHGIARHAIASVPYARREFRGRTRVSQVLEVAIHSLRDILRNRVFIAIVLGTVVLAMMVGWEVGAIVFDTSTWPVTHLIAGSLHGLLISTVMVVVITLIAGELVWKEREVGAGDIAATAPVPDWVPIVGRFLALGGVLVILQALYVFSGIVLQAVQGYYRFELPLYVKMMFGLQLTEYLLFAVLAILIHVVVNHKNLGHIAVIGAYVVTMQAHRLADLFQHRMLVFNSDTGWTYSDLNGFGPFLGAWLAFKAYWAAWALLLAILATVFWVRSTEGGPRARARLARLRLAGSAGRAAAVAGLLIVVSGGFVFYNTNILNDYKTQREVWASQVAYERTFQRFEDEPRPTITRVTLRVHVRPEERRADISGNYRLVNASGRPVRTLLVSSSTEVELDSVRFDRPATLTLHDSGWRQHVYTLPGRGLAPGDSMEMSFGVAFAPRGFPNSAIPTDVVSNGAYFDRSWLPIMAYRVSRELGDTAERRKAGLPPRHRVMPGPADTTAAARAARNDRGTDLVQMDVTISTAPDQVAVTPGRLVRQWDDNGRRWYRYVTDVPISFGVPFFSARYAVREADWNGVPLKVFYHPTHAFNIDRMVAAMRRSLGYNTASFGPYRFHELRVVEFPRYASFARAHPHTIAFSEGSAFITRIDPDSRVDRTFFVVAHETAHQWWGNALRPAQMKGAGMLSETLAQYSAMMAIEKEYGSEMAWRLYGYDRERYLSGRQRFASREAPLVEVEDQEHVYYSKGMMAMYTLRDMLGEVAVNTALRRFYGKHANSGPPYPTSPDLIAELRAVTPDSLQHLVTDLFETITLYDVKTDSIAATQVGDQWRVTIDVSARKLRADSIGNETEIPMNDLMEIGVFDESVGDSQGLFGKTLYHARHRIATGKHRIVVSFPASLGKPTRGGIDPYGKLIDRNDRIIPQFDAQASRTH